MKAGRRLLIVAVILGLVTVVALNYYLKNLTSGAPALVNAAYTNVVVAKSTIPEHTRITAEMIEVESILVDAVHPEAVKRADDVIGYISRTEIIKGEQLLTARVAIEGRASLSYRIPEKLRAISLPVNDLSGVAGYISPGDKVDVLVTYSDEEINNGVTITYTIIQNALVMAAGEFTKEQDSEAQHLVSTITLAVTPGQAEVLAYALHKGSFHYTLRTPLDEERVPLQHYSAENFGTFRER